MTNQKAKFERDASGLMSQLEEAEHNVGSMSKEKSRLAQLLEDAKAALEDETRVCFSPLCSNIKKNLVIYL